MAKENTSKSTASSKSGAIKPGSGEPTAPSKSSEIDRAADPAEASKGRQQGKTYVNARVCLDADGRDEIESGSNEPGEPSGNRTVYESASVDLGPDDEPAEPAESGKVKEISEAKLKANRENAQKSTGPKTVMGKGFSRRNAFKHGLFARGLWDFTAQGEDPEELQVLINGLRDDYRPVGRAEDLEVQRIAHCWWKLKRVWRHENAVNRVALRNEAWREIQCGPTTEEQEKAVISMLWSATKEMITGTGEISQALKQQMFATMPGLEVVWPGIEETSRERMSLPPLVVTQPLNARLRADIGVQIARVAINLIKEFAQTTRSSFREIAVAQRIIPKRDDLERILRYETAADRSLSRALDRLERLQSRRRANGSRRSELPDSLPGEREIAA